MKTEITYTEAERLTIIKLQKEIHESPQSDSFGNPHRLHLIKEYHSFLLACQTRIETERGREPLTCSAVGSEPFRPGELEEIRKSAADRHSEMLMRVAEGAAEQWGKQQAQQMEGRVTFGVPIPPEVRQAHEAFLQELTLEDEKNEKVSAPKTTGLTFGEALEAMKAGKKVGRGDREKVNDDYNPPTQLSRDNRTFLEGGRLITEFSPLKILATDWFIVD